MPFVTTINQGSSFGSPSEKFGFERELLSLRTELDDMRAKYAALVALLVAGTVLGAGYSAGTALAARTFTAT